MTWALHRLTHCSRAAVACSRATRYSADSGSSSGSTSTGERDSVRAEVRTAARLLKFLKKKSVSPAGPPLLPSAVREQQRADKRQIWKQWSPVQGLRPCTCWGFPCSGSEILHLLGVPLFRSEILHLLGVPLFRVFDPESAGGPPVQGLRFCTCWGSPCFAAEEEEDSHCSSQRPGSTISRPWVSASSSQRWSRLACTSCSRCCLRSARRSLELMHTGPCWQGTGRLGSDINSRDSLSLGPFSTMALHRPCSCFGAHTDTWVTPKVKRGECAGSPHFGVPGPWFQFCRDSCSQKTPSPGKGHQDENSGMVHASSYLLHILGGLWTKKKKKGEVRGCLATSPGAQIAHQMTYQLGLPATPGLPV